MSSNRSTWWRRARFALLLAPAALMAGCYVVPVVPAGRPYYRHPGPPPGPYYRGYDRGYDRGYYRGYRGEAEQVTPPQRVADATPAYIAAASIAR